MKNKAERSTRRCLRQLMCLMLCLALGFGLPGGTAFAVVSGSFVVSDSLESDSDRAGMGALDSGVTVEKGVIASEQGLEVKVLDYFSYDENYGEVYLGIANRGDTTATVRLESTLLNHKSLPTAMEDVTLGPGQSATVTIGVDLNLLLLSGDSSFDSLTASFSLHDAAGRTLGSFESKEIKLSGVKVEKGIAVFEAPIVEEKNLRFNVVGFGLRDGLPVIYIDSRNNSGETLYILGEGCSYNGEDVSFFHVVRPNTEQIQSCPLLMDDKAEAPESIKLSFTMDVSVLGDMVKVSGYSINFGQNGKFSDCTGAVSVHKNTESWRENFADGSEPLPEPTAEPTPEPTVQPAADGAPVITGQPRSLTAAEGSMISLGVEAEGENLSYKWQVKGPDEPWEDSGISCADESVLSFKISAIHDRLLYRCVVSNEFGSVTSDAAELTVTESYISSLRPQILQSPQSVTGSVGDPVSFSVEAGGEELRYCWQVKAPDEPWENSTIATAGERILSFKLQEHHDGLLYRCVVSNAYGSIFSEPAAITIRSEAGPGYSIALVGDREMYLVHSGSFGAEQLAENLLLMTGRAELVGDGISYGFFEFEEPVEDVLMFIAPVIHDFWDGYEDYGTVEWTGACCMNVNGESGWGASGSYFFSSGESVYLKFILTEPADILAFTTLPIDSPYKGEYFDSMTYSTDFIFGFATAEAAEAFIARMSR